MNRVMLAALLACLASAGCQKSTDKVGAPAPEPTTSATGESAIHGRAFYLERVQLPPDTVLEVQLVSDRQADVRGSVIAQQRFTNLKGPPYDFTLPFDRSRTQAGARYSLQATLSDADGHAQFATDTRVPVNPDNGKVVQFRVVRVPGN